VIPTTYKFNDGDELDGYVYTVNNRETQRGFAPTVTFSYDFQPLRVVVSEEQAELSEFLTQVCAIIGGVFTVTGIVDAILHGASDFVLHRRKNI